MPPSLHISVLPAHSNYNNNNNNNNDNNDCCERFLSDLRDAVSEVRANKRLKKKGTAAMYGMVGAIPDKSIVDELVVQFLGKIYT